jgi:hypothetical protein
VICRGWARPAERPVGTALATRFTVDLYSDTGPVAYLPSLSIIALADRLSVCAMGMPTEHTDHSSHCTHGNHKANQMDQFVMPRAPPEFHHR